jgi:O-antigen/teichoic acid export membrane protein
MQEPRSQQAAILRHAPATGAGDTGTQERRTSLRHMGVMVGATSVNNVLGYVYTILMGRMLGPIEFGILVAVQALFDLLAISGSAIRTIVARQVAAYEACQQRQDTCHLWTASIWRTVLYTGAVTLLFFLLRGPLMRFLGIPTAAVLIVAAMGLIPVMARALLGGFLQGLQWFTALGGLEMATGTLRVLVGVLLVSLGAGAAGAMAAQPTAAGIVAVFGLVWLGTRIRRGGATELDVAATAAAPPFEPLPVVLSLFAFAALTQMDAILVKSFFSAQQAGQYAAAVTLGKIILMLPTAISTVLLPKATRAFTLRQDSGAIMWLSLALVAVPCGMLAGAYALWPEMILKVVLGSQYAVSGVVLGVLGAAMTLRALTNVWLNYFLSIRRNSFLYAMLAAVAIQAVWLALFHENLVQVVVGLMGTALLLNVVGMILFRRWQHECRPATVAAPPISG